MRRIFTIVALLGTVSLTQAQALNIPKTPNDKSLSFSEAQLQSIIKSVPPSKQTGKPGGFSIRLFDASTFSNAFIRLSEPDQPHAHGAWSEIFVIKEGSGILETGGTIGGTISHDSNTHRALYLDNNKSAAEAEAAAAKSAAQGDKAGTTLEGGHKQRVGPGDVILVPAGVAHHWFQIDKPVVFLDIKSPKAE